MLSGFGLNVYSEPSQEKRQPNRFFKFVVSHMKVVVLQVE